MSKPQQPDLARSGHGATDPASAKAKTSSVPEPSGPSGPVPSDNQPGHHPDVEQDKPTGPPPTPRSRRRRPEQRRQDQWQDGTRADEPDRPTRRFAFAFERRMVPFSALFGVTPWTARVTITGEELDVRFGPWRLVTPLANVAGAEVTGPYRLPFVAGPAHLSFRDRGVTFATTTSAGVCVRFHEPVRALPLLTHPAATITVDQPDELVELLEERMGG